MPGRRLSLFNKKMNWWLEARTLFQTIQAKSDLDVSKHTWYRQIMRSIRELRIEWIPGTYSGRLTFKQYTAVEPINSAGQRSYMLHRMNAARPDDHIKRFFGESIPLTHLPKIFIEGLSLNLKQWENNGPLFRTLEVIIGDLSIENEYIRLLMTLALIMMKSDPLPVAQTCLPDGRWGRHQSSQRHKGKWMVSFVFTGLYHRFPEVHRTRNDLVPHSMLYSSMLREYNI